MSTPMQKLVDNFIESTSSSNTSQQKQDEYLTLNGSIDENKYSNAANQTLELCERDLYSDDANISENASQQLAKIGFLAVKILTKALRSDISHVAINAANAIKTIGPNAKTAVFELTWMLHHCDKKHREVAAATLGLLRSLPGVSVYALAQALKDHELTVRQYASAALGEFNGADLTYVTNEMQLAIHDPDKNVETFLQYALSKTEA